MKRRHLLLGSGAFGALAVARVRAQPKQPRIIGWMSSFSRESQKQVMKDFSGHLARLGHAEGRDFIFEARWAEANVASLPALARELVALKPAVIVTGGTAAITALKAATSTVPIVFTSAGNPVREGLVASLAHPGGNITGVTNRPELQAKLFDLIREVLPATRRVALLVHESDPITGKVVEMLRAAAESLKYEPQVISMDRIEDIDRALVAAAKSKAEAVVAPILTLLVLHSQKIGALALKARLPLFGTARGFTTGGAVLSYFHDFRDSVARAAALTGKILRGASPADLPVEQPDRYTLAVNLRAAAALGIKMPEPVVLRADEVIR